MNIESLKAERRDADDEDDGVGNNCEAECQLVEGIADNGGDLKMERSDANSDETEDSDVSDDNYDDNDDDDMEDSTTRRNSSSSDDEDNDVDGEELRDKTQRNRKQRVTKADGSNYKKRRVASKNKLEDNGRDDVLEEMLECDICNNKFKSR